MVALELAPSLDVVSTMVGATHRHYPIPVHVATYDRLKPIFMRLPAKLADEYSAIAAYQEAGGAAADGRS
jgi:gluconokinase